MTEHGKIHTDGSRSGGQPVTNDKSAEYTKLLNEVITLRWKCGDQAAELAALRQPTQSDAVRDQLLQECLVKLRDVQGTEAPKQYACNLIKRIERVLQEQSK